MSKAKRRKKATFANSIIMLCVGVSLLITLATLFSYYRADTVVPAGVLTALFGFWGGELLIVALRQIFGSDVMNKKSSDTASAGIEESDEGSI